VQSALTEMEAAGIAVDRASLDHLLERRVAVDGLLNSIASDGRIHTTFHQTASATGRIASSDPTLHDIPTDPDEAASVRDAFVAGDGYGELMSAGYSQLEMRVMAYLSGDLRGVVDDARMVGYVSTLLGRRRYLPGLDSANRQVREAADRDARAMLVQGGAADVINVAMINVDKAIKDSGLKSRMLLQVDGELLFEVAAGEREALAAHVREQMGGEHPLHVPLEVSIGCGPNWAAAAQWATLNNETGK
jgi:DNA polymerase-1